MLQKHVSWYTQSPYHCAEGCTPIDLKDDTVVEHPCRPLCSVSLHTVYPAGWLLSQTLDQCGTRWNCLSCGKATTPLQIPSQHTMTAALRRLWPKDKTLSRLYVCVCVCCKLVLSVHSFHADSQLFWPTRLCVYVCVCWLYSYVNTCPLEFVCACVFLCEFVWFCVCICKCVCVPSCVS